jgi:hypothetical protein
VALLPGRAGGHEDHLVEAEEAGDLARRDEVPVMDGIESPAHHSESATCHRTRVSGGHRSRPVRTGSGREPRFLTRVREVSPAATGSPVQPVAVLPRLRDRTVPVAEKLADEHRPEERGT